MTRQTPIAAVCLAAAATFGVVTWGQPQPAGVGGDPCPADIDDDGVVGINDFLHVLGTWGPCPSGSRVVHMNTFTIFSGTQFLVRLRSDNRLEFYLVTLGADCWNCDEAFPQPNTWTDFTPPPLPVDAVPVAVVSFDQSPVLHVAYSDGSVFRGQVNVGQFPGGTNCDGDYCILSLGDWNPLP